MNDSEILSAVEEMFRELQDRLSDIEARLWRIEDGRASNSSFEDEPLTTDELSEPLVERVVAAAADIIDERYGSYIEELGAVAGNLKLDFLEDTAAKIYGEVNSVAEKIDLIHRNVEDLYNSVSKE